MEELSKSDPDYRCVMKPQKRKILRSKTYTVVFPVLIIHNFSGPTKKPDVVKRRARKPGT